MCLSDCGHPAAWCLVGCHRERLSGFLLDGQSVHVHFLYSALLCMQISSHNSTTLPDGSLPHRLAAYRCCNAVKVRNNYSSTIEVFCHDEEQYQGQPYGYVSTFEPFAGEGRREVCPTTPEKLLDTQILIHTRQFIETRNILDVTYVIDRHYKFTLHY